MQLDEMKVQRQLSNWLVRKGHDITIPNISWSWLYWEADLISITKAGFLHEYEIKISRADFMADFKKRKHRTFKARIATNRVPNYFTYVAPIAAIPICVPSYAGLIEIAPSSRYGHTYDLLVVKKPALMHRSKQTDASKLAMLRALMFKYWDLAATVDKIKIQKELFKG